MIFAKNRSHYRPLVLSAVVVGMVGGLILLWGGSAQAGFSEMPSVLPQDPDGGSYQFLNLTNGANDPGTGDGAFLPASWLKVYGQNSNAQTVSFGVVNRKVGPEKACNNYKITWGTKSIDSNGIVGPYNYGGTAPGGLKQIPIKGCTPGAVGDYKINIPAGKLNRQTNVPGSSDLYAAILVLLITEDGPPGNNPPIAYAEPQTATLRLYADPAGRLVQTGSATIYSSFDHNGNKLSAKFRPACNIAPNTSKTITWKDDDYKPGGTDRQGSEPQAKVYEYTPPDFATKTPVTPTAGPVYGNGGQGYVRFNMQPGKAYELRFENVDGANGIMIDYPFESGDFWIPCPTVKPGEPFTVSVSCAGVTLGNVTKPVKGKFFRGSARANNGDAGASGNDHVAGSDFDIQPPGAPGTVNVAWPAELTTLREKGWTVQVGTYDAGNPASYVTYYGATIDPGCYQATCSVTVQGIAGQANKVEAGKTFKADVTLTNPDASIAWGVFESPELPTRVDAQPRGWGAAGGGAQRTDVTQNLPLPGAIASYKAGPRGGSPHSPATYALSTTVKPGGPWGLDAVQFNDFAEQPTGGAIYPGDSPQTAPSQVDFRAPSTIGTYSLQMYPDYYGLMGLGGTCSGEAGVEITTYKPFALTPFARTNAADVEDPDVIELNLGVNEGGADGINPDGTPERDLSGNPWPTQLPETAKVPATTTRTFTATHSDGTPFAIDPNKLSDVSGATNPETHTYSRGFSIRLLNAFYRDNDLTRSFQAGDKICSNITIDHHTGYVGPGDPGDVIGANPKTASDCITIANRPYVRAYGADVAAGGQFTGNPTPSVGGINAYTRRGSEFGSGAEFAAIALEAVEGFGSANLRTVPPLPLKGLTFANPLTGEAGKFAASRPATDYYENTRMPDIPRPSATTSQILLQSNGAENGQQNWVKAPATGLELRNPGVGTKYNKRHTLYVEGNVVIKDNIIYDKTNPGESWINLADIPNFTLIVKGNIYISSDVEQLDGLYVAQPQDVDNPATTDVVERNNKPNTGKIYTCAKPDGTLYGTAGLYNACRTKLKINGALVSQDTKFLRTFGTLSERPEITHGTPAFSLNWSHNSSGGANCTEWVETGDPYWGGPPNNWRDNYLCWEGVLGLDMIGYVGHTAQPPNSTCVSLNNPNVNPANGWADNRLCAPNSLNMDLSMHWEYSHPADKDCLNIDEGGTDGAWAAGRVWLCWRQGTDATYTKETFFPTSAPGFDQDKAAESINLGPEMYLSRPVFFSRSNGGTYQYFVALPPVL